MTAVVEDDEIPDHKATGKNREGNGEPPGDGSAEVDEIPE